MLSSCFGRVSFRSFVKTYKNFNRSTIYSFDRFVSKNSSIIMDIMSQYKWYHPEIKPDVIFVLGGPGSGKGTLCQRIMKEFNYRHLSAGDLLREEQKTSRSKYGELIADHIKNGTIVPVEITCALLMNAMQKHIEKLIFFNAKQKSAKFLIDGFPRNQDNLDGWNKYVNDKVNVQFVLFLECPEEVCVQRCLERGKHSGRTDDNPESLQKRFRTYLNQTIPIIEYYDKLNLVKRIDSCGTPDEVFEAFRKLILDLEKPKHSDSGDETNKLGTNVQD